MTNRKPTVTLTLIFAMLLILGLGALKATEMPDEIILDRDIYGSNRKGPVTFSHQMHAEDYDVACKECHHIYEDGKNIWEDGDSVEKCASCHDPFESEDKAMKLRTAFHKNCKGCHKQLKKEGISDDAPYRKCTDCHERTS